MADDASAKFTVDLAINGVAETAEGREEIEKLRGSLDRNIAAVARMTKAYRNLKTGGLENSAQAQHLKARIEEMRKSIGTTQSKLLGMRGSLNVVSDASEKASAATLRADASVKKLAVDTKTAGKGVNQFAEGINIAGGPVASFTARAGGLAVRLSKAGVAGAAIAAMAAIVALDYVIVKATANLARMAVTAADAYRSENLALQGMTKAWVGWWGQVKAGKADDVQSAIDEVSSSVTLGRDKVASYAESLYRSRLRGQALKDALMGVSMAASAAGDEFGEVAKAQVVSAAMWGQSVKGMSDTFKARFGGIVQEQMLALPTQIAKAKENFAALFRGIKVEPVLRGINRVLSVFGQGTVQFKAWKQMFESLFNPLFQGAESGAEVVRTFINKLTILALRGMLAWEELKGSFRTQDSSIKLAKDSLHLVINAMSNFALITLRGTQALIILGDSILTKVRPGLDFLMFAMAKLKGDSAGAAEAWSAFKKHAAEFSIGSEGARSGLSMIEGLVNGIKAAQPALNRAVEESAKEANETFRKAQDIHSPSRVWGRFGVQLPRGAAVGVRAGIPEFRRSVQTLATIPEAQPTRADASLPYTPRRGEAFSRGGSSASVTIQNITIQSAPSAPGTVTIPISELKMQLASILEGIVIQSGGRV